MSAMQKLTLLNLKRNRVRTVVTIIGIILSTALMTVVTGVVSSGRQTLIDTAINQNGDWTVRLDGAFDEESANDLRQPFSDNDPRRACSGGSFQSCFRSCQ